MKRMTTTTNGVQSCMWQFQDAPHCNSSSNTVVQFSTVAKILAILPKYHFMGINSTLINILCKKYFQMNIICLWEELLLKFYSFPQINFLRDFRYQKHLSELWQVFCHTVISAFETAGVVATEELWNQKEEEWSNHQQRLLLNIYWPKWRMTALLPRTQCLPQRQARMTKGFGE